MKKINITRLAAFFVLIALASSCKVVLTSVPFITTPQHAFAPHDPRTKHVEPYKK